MKSQTTRGARPNTIGLIWILTIVISSCLPQTPVSSNNLISPTSALPTPISKSGIGTSQVSLKDSMVMVFVPAGKFIMGSDDGNTDEQPVHTVTLDAFWIDQTEITNSMYSLCVKSGTCHKPSSTTYYSDPDYSDHPAVFVSWSDAITYCSWADRRLPTEAEWEKAATWNPTANEKLTYPWGNDFDCKKGNFDDETQLDSFVMPGGPNCDEYARTSPVGSFPAGASPYGALDMAGNVWEWVHDAFIETDPLNGSTQNYYAISPASNPTGVDPEISDYRVMRGGSWNVNFGFGRSAYRLWFGLDDSYDFTGFRCARSQ
jgi:formylglycine-generating enzyme required for sulfatase activity